MMKVKNKLFKKWLFIQVGFLILMTIISISLYLYTANAIREHLLELYYEKIQSVESEVDASIKSAMAEGMNYIINPIMPLLSITKTDDIKEVERDFARIVDNIKQTNSSNKSVSEIILYFPELDRFISSAGVMDKEIFSQIYSYPSTNLNNLCDIINFESIDNKVLPVYTFRNSIEGVKTGVSIINMVSGMDITGRVMVLIEDNFIKNILVKNKKHDEDILLVSIDDGRNIFATIDDNMIIDEYNLDIKKGHSSIEILGIEYYCFQTVSKDTQLIYSHLIPMDLFYEKYFKFQRTSVILFVLTILLGVIISYYITLIKYRPIHLIAEKSKKLLDYDITNDFDELKQISNALISASRVKDVLNNHQKYISDGCWRMILNGKLNLTDTTDYVKQIIKISEKAEYTIVIIDVLESTKLVEIDNFMKKATSKINNLGLLHALVKDGTIILIFKNSIDYLIPEFKTIVNNLQEKIIISIGITKKGTEGIIDSYKVAKKNLNYKILPNSNNIISPYDEIVNISITIPYEKEVQFTGLIQAGEFVKANIMLDGFIEVSMNENVNPFAYKVYLYYLANSIIRSAKYLKEENDIVNELLIKFKNAFNTSTHESVIKIMKEALLIVCTTYKEKQKSSNYALNARIIKWIEKNLYNNQLNPNLVADTFKLNQSYLRSFFKEQNGLAFWDYINTQRILLAQEKLIHTTNNIITIATSCGYISLSTFVRSFKKLTGMTPGQYRKLSRLKEEL